MKQHKESNRFMLSFQNDSVFVGVALYRKLNYV